MDSIVRVDYQVYIAQRRLGSCVVGKMNLFRDKIQFMKQRIMHIDIAKGIGILLILASHVVLNIDAASPLEANIYKHWTQALSSFYVPVFFILSGLFESDKIDWKIYVKRLVRCAKYIVVFVLWGICAHVIINQNIDVLKGALTYTPIWFLFVLFQITSIFGLIRRAPLQYQYFIVLLGGVIGTWLALGRHSYFYVGQTMLCLPFYAIGFWGKHWFKQSVFHPKVAFYSFVVWVVLTFSHDGDQNIAVNWINKDMVSFYINAIAGSICLMEVCKCIKNRLLLYMGSNSLIIMMVHFMFIHWNYQVLHIDISSLWVWAFFVLIWTFLSVAFIPLFRNKYYQVV